MQGNAKTRLVAFAAAAAVVTGTVVAPAFSQEAPSTTSTTSSETFKERIVEALGPGIATATPEDIEGAIIFVINQGDYDDAVIDSALTSLVNSHGTPNVVTAVASVRAALAKGKNRRGTAATNDGVGGVEFSSPSSSGAGGGSGYTLS